MKFSVPAVTPNNLTENNLIWFLYHIVFFMRKSTHISISQLNCTKKNHGKCSTHLLFQNFPNSNFMAFFQKTFLTLWAVLKKDIAGYYPPPLYLFFEFPDFDNTFLTKLPNEIQDKQKNKVPQQSNFFIFTRVQ